MAVTKRSANGRQLLLLAALLFGIVTMHTLGHPTGHSTSPTAGHSSSLATNSATNSAASSTTSHTSGHTSGPEQAVGRHEMSATDEGANISASSKTSTSTSTSGMDPLSMDPMSVCLAVLAALTLLLLLKAGLLRPGGFAVPARPLARLLDGLRPNPPPPRITLSRLSVLRI